MEERLKKLVGIIDAGSFTAAARSLHVSQPSLTVAMNLLERELGAKLIIRTSRPLKLTHAGRAAYEAGTSIIVTGANLTNTIKHINSERPELKIGMIDSVAQLFESNFDPISSIEDSADLTVIVNNSRLLTAMVLKRELDAAFVISSKPDKGLCARPIGVDTLYLVTSPELMPKIKKGLSRAIIDDFICYDQESMTYLAILTELASLGLTLKPRMFSSSTDVMRRMALSGKGVVALPWHTVRQDVASGNFVLVYHKRQPIMLLRSIYLISLRERTLLDMVVPLAEQVEVLLEDSIPRGELR